MAMTPEKTSFDENFYVSKNPDVKAAIDAGTIKSGLQHFTEKGVAEGRTGFNAATSPVVSVAPAFQRRDDSVTSALTDIMSKDSPLMRQAETAGLQMANRRGLLNSSMATKATQDAAYTAALPIASQQASQAATENLANLDVSTRLFLQGRAEEQAGLDRSLQEKLAKWNLDESQRATAAQTVVSSQQLYTDRINNIMANTNLDADTRSSQLASAKAFFDTQMNLVQQMFNVRLNWS
jgi:hypothetical protein